MVLISIPLILETVPPNGVYGFRTRYTMSSPSIWYPANAFAGWTLLVAGIVSIALLWTLPAPAKRWQLWASFLGPTLGAFIASLWYLQHLG